MTHRCIKCGRCMEVCPAMDHDPMFAGPRAIVIDLPRAGAHADDSACTSCAACRDACPSGIDLPEGIATVRAASLAPVRDGHRRMLGNIDTHGRSVSPGDGPLVTGRGGTKLFPGCIVAERMPRSLEASMRLLELTGGGEIVDGWVCCGSPVRRIGDDDRAERLMERNVGSGVEGAVSPCPGCVDTLSRSVFARHMVEHLHDHIDEIPFARRDVTVTVHHPCHLARNVGRVAIDMTYDLLDRIPGVEVVELDDPDVCCGGGGGVMSGRPDVARSMAARKVDDALRTGAGVMVAPCPFCALNLSSDGRIPVEELTAFLGDSLSTPGGTSPSPPSRDRCRTAPNPTRPCRP